MSKKRGRCRACGCTDYQGCFGGCEWSDESHTRCTGCVCAECGHAFEQRNEWAADMRDRRVCRDRQACAKRVKGA